MKRLSKFNESKITKSDRIIEEVGLICQDFLDNGFRLEIPSSRRYGYLNFVISPLSNIDSHFYRNSIDFIEKEDIFLSLLEDKMQKMTFVYDGLPELKDRLLEMGVSKIYVDQNFRIEFGVRCNYKMSF